MLPILPGVKSMAFTKRIIAYNLTFVHLVTRNMCDNRKCSGMQLHGMKAKVEEVLQKLHQHKIILLNAIKMLQILFSGLTTVQPRK